MYDLSTNQFFYEQHMSNVMNYVSVIAYFGSEEAIRAGDHLIWVESQSHGWYYRDEEYDDSYYSFELRLELTTPDGRYYYAQLAGHDIQNHALRVFHESEARRQQIQTLRAAQEYINNIAGLLYYINIDSSHTQFERDIDDEYQDTAENMPDFFSYSNVEIYNQNIDYFRSQPVYLIISGYDKYEQSFYTNYSHFYNFTQNIGNGSVFLAFSDHFVYEQNLIHSSVRHAYITDFGIIAASVVLALGLTILLMIAAGRKYKAVAGETGSKDRVHFTVLDKPYLDIGLALLICWITFILFLVFNSAYTLWHLGSITTMNILLAIATLLAVPPVLGWLISFAKRLKAGKFWKHTLIYAIVYSCIYGSLRFLFRAGKSLWAGARLTFKVTVISFAAFCMMSFIGVIGSPREIGVMFFFILVFTAVVAVLLMMYARRIRRLEQGAREVAEGKYYPQLDAGSGELGNIAVSINNISAGINTAVEERMKSERLKTELITNVSHDIRTPLTSIITYTDLLDHEGLDCERAPEYLDVLKQKSLRLKTLTEELFEAAKAATGNIDVNLTELDIVSLINQVLGELDSAVKSSGLDLRVNLPEKLLARADGRLMQRVMENLFSNVFKYSMPGSRVYLDADQTDPYYLRLNLKNISSQELNFDPSELTERFKRGDDSRSDGGSGLGLSIVQSFMDAQGGRFDVSIDGDLFKATVVLPVPYIRQGSD